MAELFEKFIARNSTEFVLVVVKQTDAKTQYLHRICMHVLARTFV